MLTTTTTTYTSYINHGVTLGISITICSVLLNEILEFLQTIVSAHVFTYTMSFIISWITLDNLVLCSDIEELATNHQQQNTPTDCEIELLKKLNYTTKRLEETSEMLARETISHYTTKSQLESTTTTKKNAQLCVPLHERPQCGC